MNEFLENNLLNLILGVCIPLLSFVWAWLKTKSSLLNSITIKDEHTLFVSDMIEMAITKGINFVNQTLTKKEKNETKLMNAINFANEFLAMHGIVVKESVISGIIEAKLYEMKRESELSN